MHVLAGKGWKTAATASSQTTKFAQQVIPIQGTANPQVDLVFKASIENVSAGAYQEVMRIGYDGTDTLWSVHGATPVAQSAAYTPTNVSTDRAFDANSTTLAELADVVGTMIADIQATGLFG
jgi:hypothetical protein